MFYTIFFQIINDYVKTHLDQKKIKKKACSCCSVGGCVIPWEFLGKSVKHIFSCRKMYSL